MQQHHFGSCIAAMAEKEMEGNPTLNIEQATALLAERKRRDHQSKGTRNGEASRAARRAAAAKRPTDRRCGRSGRSSQ
jgi:hypothetical protein